MNSLQKISEDQHQLHTEMDCERGKRSRKAVPPGLSVHSYHCCSMATMPFLILYEWQWEANPGLTLTGAISLTWPPSHGCSLSRRFWHATHDCVAPYVDISLHRGRFWTKSAASGSVRWCCFRSCWTVLSHVCGDDLVVFSSLLLECYTVN